MEIQLQEWHCNILYQLHSGTYILPWNWPCWEYLHLGNGQIGLDLLFCWLTEFKKVMEKILKMQIKLKVCLSVAITQCTAWKQTPFVFLCNLYPIQQSQSSLTNEWNLNTQLHYLHFYYSSQNRQKIPTNIHFWVTLKMLIKKTFTRYCCPDPLLSLTSDHCSALGRGWRCHRKTTGETVPALGAARCSAQGNGPCLNAHVVPFLSWPQVYIIHTISRWGTGSRHSRS